MTTHDDILAKARAQEAKRMAAVEKLVESRAAIAAKRAELDALQSDDARHYAGAVDAGWTEAGLKAVGLLAPVKRVPGRPARSGSSRTRQRPAEEPVAKGDLVRRRLEQESESWVAVEGETADERTPEPVGADA